ncbi:protein RALF-like 34 [Cornus florida]|uniref:protein RALF-like 34 n=1 Tax=Cornus florida TaxID=4283 RepID=UPI002897AC9A|nr:protein RALF-like 34 [Cornus florida]
MASSHLPTLVTLCLIVLLLLASTCIPRAQAQLDSGGIQLTTDALDWPSSATDLYEDDEFGDNAGDSTGAIGRRSLFWLTVRHYYISYGALSANRVPCPPRSGRSYYTHNCYRATGPVHPYTRGCSAITRCRR